MGFIQIHIFLYSMAVFCIVAPAYVSGDDIILQKRSNHLEAEQLVDDGRPIKRPFCNAFTGCGKKRSDESLATLVDLNSEPAVEELTKQILSEAKLWEAIQEARVELERERQRMMETSIPLAFAMSKVKNKRSRAETIARKLATELEQYSRKR